MTKENLIADSLAVPADASAIREEQVERALRRLEEGGGLTSHQRATVEQLGDRLTLELLALFDADDAKTEPADSGEAERELVLSSD